MTDLAAIARIPSVASAVLGDPGGGFYDAIREPDGESVAAVAGFVASALGRTGEDLGLGPLVRVTVVGPGGASVVALRGGAVVAVRLAEPGALGAVEQALVAALGTGMGG